MLARHSGHAVEPTAVLSPAEILALQTMVEDVHAEAEVIDYVVRLTRFTRGHRNLALGASPRASLALLHASRAHALLSGRPFVLPDDVKTLAIPVLAHRLVMSPEAQIDGISGEAVVRETLAQVPHRDDTQR
jgi:MoxR-like ATPase